MWHDRFRLRFRLVSPVLADLDVSNSERGYHVFSDVGTKLEFVGFNEAVHVRVATDIFSRIGLTRCLSDPYIPSADVATSSLEIRVAIRQFG